MPWSTSSRLRNQKRGEGKQLFSAFLFCQQKLFVREHQGRSHVTWNPFKAATTLGFGSESLSRCTGVEREAEVKWHFGADPSLCGASPLFGASSVSPHSSVLSYFLSSWPALYRPFRTRERGRRHRHGGDGRDPDLQLRQPLLREAGGLLGPGGHPQQRLLQRSDQVGQDVCHQQPVRALPAAGQPGGGRRVPDHQAGAGGGLRGVRLPRGYSRVVQRPQTPGDPERGPR